MGNQQEDRERDPPEETPWTPVRQRTTHQARIGMEVIIRVVIKLYGGIKNGHQKKTKNTRQKMLTTPIRKAKAKEEKAINCVTTVESQVIEHLSVPNRRERKEEEKEVGHQAKEKGSEEKEHSDKR